MEVHFRTRRELAEAMAEAGGRQAWEAAAEEWLEKRRRP